jgi:lipase
MAVLHAHRYGGGGRDVVALHGIRGHGARWQRLAGLIPEHRWTTLDLRGHGRSPWTPPWTLEQDAADVLDTMDELGLTTVDLIGHSFGGAVALTAAVLAPHRFRRLLLLDPGLSLDPEQVLRGVTEELTTQSFADLDEARAVRLAQWPGVTDPTMADDEVAEHLEQGADGRWRWRFAPAAVVTALSEMCRVPPLPPAQVPTQVVVTTRGSVVGQPFLDRLPPEVLVSSLDSGHVMYVDNLDGTATVVREFIGRVRGGRGSN